ncbi:hypothetical protein [Streptomyces inhibens]|uniref:hypothetical protein n=1 Tax=Streptomyces inhibens TaxID=2293571 RepID=UPI001EE6DFDC|nr:hypothetical protein [Streptomyces inhibens]UKY53841.1 hypothetical protein KI385_36940 [Streptomyces inhibens]
MRPQPRKGPYRRIRPPALWGEAVAFNACTAARIGEVPGVRARDIDPAPWLWTVRRQRKIAGHGQITTTQRYSAPAPATWAEPATHSPTT